MRFLYATTWGEEQEPEDKQKRGSEERWGGSLGKDQWGVTPSEKRPSGFLYRNAVLSSTFNQIVKICQKRGSELFELFT